MCEPRIPLHEAHPRAGREDYLEIGEFCDYVQLSENTKVTSTGAPELRKYVRAREPGFVRCTLACTTRILEGVVPVIEQYQLPPDSALPPAYETMWLRRGWTSDNVVDQTTPRAWDDVGPKFPLAMRQKVPNKPETPHKQGPRLRLFRDRYEAPPLVFIDTCTLSALGNES